MLDLFSTNFTPANGFKSVMTFDQYTGKEDLSKALIGKTIVQADSTDERALIELSDGSVLELRGNEGCDCGAGHYTVSSLSLVGGVIMSASQNSYDLQDDEGSDLQGYNIFIYTDKVPNGTELVSVSGDDGSGYYGTGYQVEVFAPVADL